MGGNSSDERGVRGGVCAESPGGAKECDVVRRVEGTDAGVAVGETFKQKEKTAAEVQAIADDSGLSLKEAAKIQAGGLETVIG